VPSSARAPEELRRRVDELARSGALDQGSGHVFDPTIDAWVQEWSHRIEAEHDARQSVLEQWEAHARAEAERLEQLAAQARQRLAETEQRLARLLNDRETEEV
jgi:thiamine biosynthesis lipoprotein ApbE